MIHFSFDSVIELWKKNRYYRYTLNGYPSYLSIYWPTRWVQHLEFCGITTLFRAYFFRQISKRQNMKRLRPPTWYPLQIEALFSIVSSQLSIFSILFTTHWIPKELIVQRWSFCIEEKCIENMWKWLL